MLDNAFFFFFPATLVILKVAGRKEYLALWNQQKVSKNTNKRKIECHTNVTSLLYVITKSVSGYLLLPKGSGNYKNFDKMRMKLFLISLVAI